MKRKALATLLVVSATLLSSCKFPSPSGPPPVPTSVPTPSWTPTSTASRTLSPTATPTLSPTPTQGIIATITPVFLLTPVPTHTPVVPSNSGCVTVTNDNLLSASSIPNATPGGPLGWRGFAPPSPNTHITIISTTADWTGYIAGSMDPSADPTMPFDPNTQTLVILNGYSGSCPYFYGFSSVCNTGGQVQVNVYYTQPPCCLPGFSSMYHGFPIAAGIVVENQGLPVVIQEGYISPSYPTCASQDPVPSLSGVLVVVQGILGPSGRTIIL